MVDSTKKTTPSKKSLEKKPLEICMQTLIDRAEKTERMQVGEIFRLFTRRGAAPLLIVLSFPFFLPIQIPGFSFPFGMLLALIGLQMTFFKRIIWPNWILKKTVSASRVKKVALFALNASRKIFKFFKPRITALTQSSIAQRVHGLLITILALLLAIPMPIPLTNILAALPIFMIGFALAESDGMLIILAYFMAIICFIFFFFLFYISYWGASNLFG